MKIAASVVAVLLILAGAIFALQGANILAGSAMSGHHRWLYVGVGMVIVGLGGLYWFNFRRAKV